MKNPFLERTILKILNRVETGLKEKTLQAETEIAADRADLTTDEFHDALRELEDNLLVDKTKTLLNENLWMITDSGKLAAKGA